MYISAFYSRFTFILLLSVISHVLFLFFFIFYVQVAENLLPQSQCETFIELIEDIVKQLRLDPARSLPLVAHGPPDQSAGGSPVTSRRPRDRDHSLDTAKV